MATAGELKTLADLRAEIGKLRDLVTDHDAGLKQRMISLEGRSEQILERLSRLDGLVLGSEDTRLRESSPGMYAVLMEVAQELEKRRAVGSFLRVGLSMLGGGAVTVIVLLVRAVADGAP